MCSCHVFFQRGLFLLKKPEGKKSDKARSVSPQQTNFKFERGGTTNPA